MHARRNTVSPVTLHVLVEPDAGPCLGQYHFQRGLAALKRIMPQIVAVQFDQIEGIEEDAVISAVITNEIQGSDAVVIASDSFAIDDARARSQTGQRIDDQRKAMGEVIGWTAIEPHPRPVLAGNNPKAIVLDLVQPLAAPPAASRTGSLMTVTCKH